MIDRLKPMTVGQERLLNALEEQENEIVGVFGPTGTGKSLISIVFGIDRVIKGQYKQFIIARPIVDVATGRAVSPEEMGELYYKIASAYLTDVLGGLVEREDLDKLLRGGKVVVYDVNYLRGRTFDDSVIFLDDAQNTQPENAAEMLIRMGRNAKLIVAGDPIIQKSTFTDKDGATLLREALLGEERTAVIDLGIKDIVRPGARRGVRLALELRMRKRELSPSERHIVETARIYAPDADVVSAVEFKAEKDGLGIRADAVPDALVVVKEGHLGRLVGKGGERIRNIEREVGLRLRTIEMVLDFKQWISAIHPVGWIRKHIIDADFAGPELQVVVKRDEFGGFVGRRGAYVKLIDSVFRRLISVGVRAVEGED